MDALRWIFILLAVGAAAAAALWLALSDPAASPSPTTSEPAAVAALPLNLPSAASAAPAASAVTRATAPAASTAAAPSPAPKAPVLQIGSEGYGPHIERAFVGADAAAAWEAVQWLRDCASTEQRRKSLEVHRAQGLVPEMLTQMMLEVDAEARRCQTVTAQHRAMLPELASRAMRAGVPAAASAYAAAVFAGDLTQEQRREVTDAMRRDANAGHPVGLLRAALSNEAWGLSHAEKLAFLHAYCEISNQSPSGAVVESPAKRCSFRLEPPPTPEQLAAARLAGQQIVDRARAAGKP